MKTNLLLSIIGATILTFSGCGEKTTPDETKKAETSTMKCEAGKCGAEMKKVEKTEGKCGGNTQKPVSNP